MTRDELRTVYERAMRYGNEDAAVNALSGLFPCPKRQRKPKEVYTKPEPIRNGKTYTVHRKGKTISVTEGS